MARLVPCLLTVLALFTAPSDPLAEGAAEANELERPATTGTLRIPFASREWLDVDLDVHGVTVDRLKLHQPGKVKSLFTKHDEANRGKIAVTNDTDRHVHPAVAIAILDAEGYLLASANTGKKVWAVKPGETEELDIHFGGVFRYIERGAWIYVTVEY